MCSVLLFEFFLLRVFCRYFLLIVLGYFIGVGWGGVGWGGVVFIGFCFFFFCFWLLNFWGEIVLICFLDGIILVIEFCWIGFG